MTPLVPSTSTMTRTTTCPAEGVAGVATGPVLLLVLPVQPQQWALPQLLLVAVVVGAVLGCPPAGPTSRRRCLQPCSRSSRS